MPFYDGSPPTELWSETQSGIQYQIRAVPESSIQEQWAEGQNQTTAIATVAWDDAPQFLKDMLGTVELQGSQLTRTLPELCPYTNWHYCVDAKLVQSYGQVEDGEPFADPDPAYNNWPRFKWANYQLTFRSLLYDILADDEIDKEYQRYVLRDGGYRARNIKIPGGSYVFTGTTNPVGEVGVKVEGGIQLKMKWLSVPKIPWANIRKCGGKVNANPWPSLDDDPNPAEAVLFESMDYVRRWTAAGQRVYDLTYSFLIKAEEQGVGGTSLTWNMMFSPNDGEYKSVEHPTTHKPLFETEDFDLLFQFT